MDRYDVARHRVVLDVVHTAGQGSFTRVARLSLKALCHLRRACGTPPAQLRAARCAALSRTARPGLPSCVGPASPTARLESVLLPAPDATGVPDALDGPEAPDASAVWSASATPKRLARSMTGRICSRRLMTPSTNSGAFDTSTNARRACAPRQPPLRTHARAHPPSPLRRLRSGRAGSSVPRCRRWLRVSSRSPVPCPAGGCVDR